MPRRGRIWVILVLALAVAALGYAIVEHLHPGGRPAAWSMSPASPTPSGSSAACRRKATGSAPPTRRSRSRSSTTCSARAAAPTSWRRFPSLVEGYVRPGDVKLLMRHYSVARNPLELGFFGAEAAARQGYGWQYTYLFFRNQDEAERFGIDEELMDSLAGSDRRTRACRSGRRPSIAKGRRGRADRRAARRLCGAGRRARNPHRPAR